MKAASVLFVDNPVGTGYSYTDSYDALTKDVAMVASDMMVLLQQFFSKNTEFQVTHTLKFKVQHMVYSFLLRRLKTENPIRSSHRLVSLSVLLTPLYVFPLVHRVFLSIYFLSLTEERWQLRFHSSSPRYRNMPRVMLLC